MKLNSWMCKYCVKIPFIIITPTLFFMYVVVVPIPPGSYQQGRVYSEMQSVYFCTETVAAISRGKG